ncbi:hypothetical protein [Spiroplasma endosymbiont of Aspidapion aeneum]|uniref:hypothetical protein n=1 Tax=Spiroplasma endosymbiont of Aspidapion aeneum TaxID=3066276 RepID=UPI00313C3612
MEIKELKLDSLKISMIKIPLTIGLFLIAVLPFFVFVHNSGKLASLKNNDIEKIIFIILTIGFILFLSYYWMRFNIVKKQKHKFVKKEIITLLIFSISLLLCFLFYSLDSILSFYYKENIIIFWVFYSLGFIFAIISSIYEYISKLYITNDVIASRFKKTKSNDSVKTNEEEIVIKKNIRETE